MDDMTASAAVAAGLVRLDDPNLFKLGEFVEIADGMGQFQPVDGRVQLVKVQNTTAIHSPGPEHGSRGKFRVTSMKVG